jgi:hypothetical protein
MEEGWICGFATTLGIAAVLVAGSAPSANSDMGEGWICTIAAMLLAMASIVLASVSTIDTATILVSISNRSEEDNGSETSAGSDIEGWIYAVAMML